VSTENSIVSIDATAKTAMDPATPEGRQELGARIHRAIVEAGFDSLPAFAAALGWSRALVYQYVKGAVLVQLDRLQQVAAATGKPIAWFLADDPDAAVAREAALEEQVAELQSALAEAHKEVARATQEVVEARQAAARARRDAARARCTATRQGYSPARLLEAAQEWAALAEAAGEEGQMAAAQVQAAHAWLELGHPAEARALLVEACAVAERQGDARLLASAQQELVRALQALGQTRAALAVAERLAQASEWWPRWSGLVACAALLEQQGEYAASEAKLEAAEAAIDAPGARPEYRTLALTYVASNALNLALGRGNYTEAAKMVDHARALARKADARDQEREILLSEGLVRLRMGDLAASEACLERAGRWAEWVQDARAEVLAAALRAELLARVGRHSLAKRCATEALSLALQRRLRLPAAWASYALGMAHWAAGQAEDAAQSLDRAATWAMELDACRLNMEARLGLARLRVHSSCDGAAKGITETLLDLAAAAQERQMTDLQAEAEAWAACAMLCQGAEGEQSSQLARRAEATAEAIGAWWVRLVAQGVVAFATARADASQAKHLAGLVGHDAARAARGLSIKPAPVWSWPDLWPAAFVQPAARGQQRKR